MGDKKIEILKRALAREKMSRKEAEKILESKTLELYGLTHELKKTNTTLKSLLAKKDIQLKGVFKNIVDAYCVMDFFGNVLEMNDATFKLLGLKQKKSHLNLLSFVHKDDVNITMSGYKKLMEKGAHKDLKLRIVAKDKKIKHLHINASLIYDDSDQLIAIQGIARDVTEDYQLKENIIASENRLKTLILNLDKGILLEDENCRVIMTNKKFCDLFAIPDAPDSLIGQQCSEIIQNSKCLFKHPEQFLGTMQSLVADKTLSLEDELKMTDGRILERDYIPIYEGNTFTGHLWSYNDVTLKRNYRKSLEIQKQKYSNIIANMHLGLVETNNDGEILMVNQSFSELSGYSEDELIGMKAKDVLPIDKDKALVNQKREERKKGLTVSYELQILNKSGEKKYWLVSAAPNYNFQGELSGSIGVVLDITTLKELEYQKENLLKNLEKSNDELHEYAHIVSHDLKSPLRSIFALVSWIKEDNLAILNQSSLENIALIESTLEKMELLISDILNYSSTGSNVEETDFVDLNEVVKDIHQLLFVPEHITLNVLNELPIIQGDKTKFQQLFQNLLSNAIKYNDKKQGLITIDVQEKKKHFQFAIKDNGMGIDKDYHDKIFNIFHSLNPDKESSGIGLSIVKKIVHLYQGKIWLESMPGKGTTFYFTLKK